jgi:hypothetical protein
MQAFDPIRARFPQFPILYQQLWRQGGRIAELLNRSVNRDQVAQREDLFGPETDITRIAFDQLLEDLKRFGVRIDRGSGCSAFVVGWVTGQLALLRFRCCLGYRAARAAPLLLIASEDRLTGSLFFAAFDAGLFELIEQTADLVQFRGSRLSPCQRVQDQFGSRPSKSPLDQIVNQLLLRLRPGDCGSIEVGTAADIPPHEPFFGHDLKQLQHGGVGHRTAFVNELFVHVSHRTRLALPQHPKDF